MRAWSPTLRERVRIGVVLAAGVGLALAGVLCFDLLRAVQKHREWSERVRRDLELLAAKRPAEIRPGEWEFLVGWTLNLHANCAGSHTWVTDAARSHQFVEALEERLRHPVDTATIDWIWDEYESFTSGGRRYSQQYRPTCSPELKDAQPGCFNLKVK